MKNNIETVIASITAILHNNGLSELSLDDTDELTEPTNVVWYDKDGNPYDDRVTGVFWDGEELSLEVEASEFSQRERIYSYDFAFSNIDWLRGVRDNMLEVFQRDGRRRCPACGKVLSGEDKYCSDECRRQECQPDLNRYYRENKDSIHSSIMELACDLAAARLMNEHSQLFEAFVEPDAPDDPESGTHYKDEFQDEFNRYYDKQYERIARLMKFDFGSDDGIRREDEPENFSMQLARLVDKAHAWQREARSLIIETLRRNSGRISFLPQNPEERPVAASLYGHKDFPRVDLTDVYIEEGLRTYIMADGVDTETGDKRTGFQIQDEQLYDIALLLKWVL